MLYDYSKAFILDFDSSSKILVMSQDYSSRSSSIEASVTSTDDAFIKMMKHVTNHRRSAPLFLVDTADLSHIESSDGVSRGVRIFSSSEPFFYSLNKNQIDKMTAELRSSSFSGLIDRMTAKKLYRTTVKRVADEALRAHYVANMYVTQYRYQYSRDSDRVRAVDQTKNIESDTQAALLSAPVYTFKSFLKDPLDEISLDHVLTRLDLLISFIYTGTKSINLADIEAENTDNLHPMFLK